MFNHFLKDFFDFSKGERIGILVLLVLIFFLLAGHIIINHIKPGTDFDSSEFREKVNEWYTEETLIFDSGSEDQNFSHKDNIEYRLSNFDPNSAGKSKLRELGVNEKTTNTLLKYREKGGVFYKKEDLRKIYGLSDSLYEVLAPYIQISVVKNEKTIHKEPAQVWKEEKEEVPLIELNRVDSAGLLPLPGIGPVYAGRIVKYRNLLGGFYSGDQLKEVYGLSSETFEGIHELIYLDTSFIKKIDLNKVSVKQLIRHPYLNTYQAEAILYFRDYHGRFESVSELLQNKLLPAGDFEKAKHYFVIKK
ncbi:MAG: helix-hairpin-helix domain-containing protein [Bacteroidota bacterium]|nr:helix-hairpin-helix domain-containing protein [Bacteroidota bacterium]